MEQPWALILAAGEGKRMYSSQPKVLHELCGRPMIEYVLESAEELTSMVRIVVGHSASMVQEKIGLDRSYVLQEQQQGTGHAVMQALPDLPDEGTLMVLCGDVPLLTAEHLKTLLKIKKNCSVVVASVIMADPTGYGRIVRGNGNQVLRIVEEKDASAEEKQITEINTGTYCFDLRLLKHYLPLVNNINAQGEYYLTDVVAALSGEGHSVESYQLDEPCLGLGINTRLQLAEAASVMRERICHRLMMQGVTIEDPGSTYIDDKVEVGPDTIIRPGSVIEKGTRVGSRCIIGPYSHLVNAEVGDEALIEHASVKNTLVNSGEYIGPYTVKDR